MPFQPQLSCEVRRRTAGPVRILRALRRDGDLRSPSCEDLDQFFRKAADRFTQLVDLTWHDAGPGVVVDGANALPGRLSDEATERFPEVSQVSVRGDLLRDPAEVDRVAAEVSAMLLETDGGAA
jgi:hypothetical protein